MHPSSAATPKKYELLIQQLRKEISDAATPDKLASEAALCRQFQVSRITVRRAIAELSQEGLLESIQGKGTFIRRDIRYTAPRFHRVGLITYKYEREIFGDIIQYAEQLLAKNGYTTVIHRTDENVADKRLTLQKMLTEKVDGLIIEGILSDLPCFNLDIYQQIEAMGLPVVFTNGFHKELAMPHITINDSETIANIVDYLVSLGHRRIGGIFCDHQYQTKMRYRGFLDGLLRNNLEYQDNRVMFSSVSRREHLFDTQFYVMKEALLHCTAMVCYNDSMARFLEGTLSRMGILVPDQMSITGLDNLNTSRLYQTKLSTAQHPTKQLVEGAVDMLLTMVKTRRPVPDRVVETQFVPGNTTAPPRSSRI